MLIFLSSAFTLIGADWLGSGSWDHNACVTQVDNYYGTYSNGAGSNLYCKDYKEDQHINNYHAWVSTNANNWEAFDPRQIVAIVRR